MCCYALTICRKGDNNATEELIMQLPKKYRDKIKETALQKERSKQKIAEKKYLNKK